MDPVSYILLVLWSYLGIRRVKQLRTVHSISWPETVAYAILWGLVFWPLSMDTCTDALTSHLKPHYKNKQRLPEFIQTFGSALCNFAAVCMHCAWYIFIAICDRAYRRVMGLEDTQILLHHGMTVLSATRHEWPVQAIAYACMIVCRSKMRMPTERHILAFACYVWIQNQKEAEIYGKIIATSAATLSFILP